MLKMLSGNTASNLLEPYFDADAEQTPPESNLIRHFNELSVGIKSVVEAQAAYQEILPLLEAHKGNRDLLFAAMQIIEKQRFKSGMLESWAALQEKFPGDILALRMQLRWLRRLKRTDEGLALITRVLPNRATLSSEAVTALLALTELKAFEQIDEMMTAVLAAHLNDSKLRILYARCLMQQNRFIDAGAIVKQITNPEMLSAAPRKVIAEALEQARFQKEHAANDPVAILGRLVSQYADRKVKKYPTEQLGTTIFLTGQLGAGGAERQMTRMAARLERKRTQGEPAFGVEIVKPVQVAVRHANPESGSDFFLPVLLESGINPEIFSIKERPSPIELFPDNPKFSRLVAFLPDDILDATLRLIPYFRAQKPEIVYLWQDGAIVIGALAALAACVPKVVLSFRGLPPNCRPDLFRPEMESLYKILATIPGVMFSANSAAAAKEYSAWLGCALDKFTIVYNAIEPQNPRGELEDIRKWDEICARSPECRSTVLGVFRFDHNKRPELWLQIAARYIDRYPDTRFVIVGSGNEFHKCKNIVEELGLENRIFLNGRSKCVGFWLSRASALLQSSRFEGLPNSIIEAQMGGVPVVVTPAGGTIEALEHGRTGYCLSSFEEPSVNEAIEYLRKILSDPAHRKEMGQNAVKFASEKFSIEQSVNSTMRLFKSC